MSPCLALVAREPRRAYARLLRRGDRIETAAIVVAVLAGLLSFGSAVYTTRLTHRLTERAREKTRAERVADVMALYRDPLLRAAFDLQSRLYNIAALGFLGRYGNDPRPDLRNYATDNTLYVLAEYLGWVEILRREVRFLDVGDQAGNRALAEQLDAVRRALLSDAYDARLQILNGQQRAIGELVAVPAEHSGQASGGMVCMGYAAFVARLDGPDFQRWFGRLRADVADLAVDPGGSDRLVALQHALVDLITLLDPEGTRLPSRDRERVKRMTGQEADAAADRVAGSPGRST